MRLLLGSVCLCVVVACGDGGTFQLILAVETDLVAPSEVIALSIQLQGPSGVSEPLVAPLQGDAARDLPLTLGLRTAYGASTPVGVRVCAQGGSADGLCVLQQTTFQSDTRLWSLALERSCSAVCCASGQTCRAGRCELPMVPGASLPAWDGTVRSSRVATVCDRGGAELCNGIDDDCDGAIDEGYNLANDNNNCGVCGRRCGNGGCNNGSCGGQGIGNLAAGGAHACVVRNDGSVACWGRNQAGQLGDGGRLDSATAVQVQAISGAERVVAGTAFSCGLAGGRVSCWGDNTQGQLGEAGAGSSVPGLASVQQVAAGAEHVCARSGARVSCWGSNRTGQLGPACSGGRCASPVEVSLPADARFVAAGGGHSCAVVQGGKVHCWGSNSDVQLGASNAAERGPVEVPLPSAAVGVAAGRNHSCAWTGAGEVWCWGGNEHGQLGNMAANLQDSAMPRKVDAIDDASSVDLSRSDSSFGCAIDGGRVRCWGENAKGQLGGGAGLDSVLPSMVNGINGPKAVAAGGQFACAVDATNVVWCWGKPPSQNAAEATPVVPSPVRCVF